MIRLIISILLLVGAWLAFTQFTSPTFASIDALREEGARLDVALTKANELKAERTKLSSRFNLFSEEEKERLGKFLPETVDNVRFLIDIDRMASAHGLRISGVNIESSQVIEAARTGTSYGVVNLSFTVESTYAVFLAFLADLEKSLRLIDVADINFSVGDSPAHSFDVSVQTYWLPSTAQAN